MGRVRASDVAQCIGLVGDIHTESVLLERSLAFLQGLGVDLLLSVGDVVDGPEEVEGANRCCELLRQYGVHTVCGNHDRWLLEDVMRDLPDAIGSFELEPESLRLLEGLPPTLTFATPEGELLLCHGLGTDDMAWLSPVSIMATEPQARAALEQLLEGNRYRFVVSGHSHRRFVRRIGDTTFINVGTLHRGYHPTIGLLDLTTREIVFHGISKEKGPWVEERIPVPACPRVSAAG